ncbi:hypothetical protein [Hyphomicrobium sp. MC1]|uniref:hypothetical protein n=1 Tax=Hyphomicrobium sp. (strain MC1) TaxID=717785 RepID=UPI000213DF54|nr:hypothetical protein [Hyphomicrobium sp. MC1]CCB64569.1 protein of unknown function [Hyphomicrobium sp. MC1]
MKPLVVYLDTSDLIAMREADPEAIPSAVFRRLMGFKNDGAVIFPISFFQYFEYMQAADAKFTDDRYQRARFLLEVSGGWSFPYYEDLLDDSVPQQGPYWIPQESLNMFDVDGLARDLRARVIKLVAERNLANRRDRRKLASPTGFQEFLRNNPSTTAHVQDDYSDKLYSDVVARDVVIKYLLGEIDRNSANEIIRSRSLTFGSVYHWFFEHGRNDNPMTDKLRELKRRWEDRFEELRSAMMRAKEIAQEVAVLEKSIASGAAGQLKSDLRQELLIELKRQKASAKNFASRPIRSPLVDTMRKAPGASERFQLIAVEVLNAIACEKVQFKPSLLGDLLHSVYLPFCDLWRGDRSFSHILFTGKVPNAEKVVSKLQDLPSEIEKKLGRNSPR